MNFKIEDVEAIASKSMSDVFKPTPSQEDVVSQVLPSHAKQKNYNNLNAAITRRSKRLLRRTFENARGATCPMCRLKSTRYKKAFNITIKDVEAIASSLI